MVAAGSDFRLSYSPWSACWGGPERISCKSGPSASDGKWAPPPPLPEGEVDTRSVAGEGLQPYPDNAPPPHPRCARPLPPGEVKLWRIQRGRKIVRCASSPHDAALETMTIAPETGSMFGFDALASLLCRIVVPQNRVHYSLTRTFGSARCSMARVIGCGGATGCHRPAAPPCRDASRAPRPEACRRQPRPGPAPWRSRRGRARRNGSSPGRAAGNAP
jgi:hypothetical protein